MAVSSFLRRPPMRPSADHLHHYAAWRDNGVDLLRDRPKAGDRPAPACWGSAGVGRTISSKSHAIGSFLWRLPFAVILNEGFERKSQGFAVRQPSISVFAVA